ncbi:MAG: hypothetical protein NTX44_04840 [Ignavibacteriales bacterium]|nr:hypothetical protein [Ignavibacteriales bacterium]
MIKNLLYTLKHLMQVLLVILILCSTICIAKAQANKNILATIGNKTITIAEFKARSEFTVRPVNYKDKTITLNNLIIEKILALEAGKNYPLASHLGFQARLKGIKEQTMRELLYRNVAYNKTAVDNSKIKSTYTLSKREYELEFYRMHKNMAQRIKTVIDSASEKIDNIFKDLSEVVGNQPVRKVNYKDPDDDAIHEALYSKPLHVGEVVGPIELSNGEYLVMKVLNWTTYPLIGEIDQQEQWSIVQEKEHRILASKVWQSYQSKIMRGKKIEFNGKTFIQLAHWARDKYLSEQNKKTLAENGISEIPFKASGLDLSAPFFTFENRTWTVGDFRDELMSHPFLFRTTHLDTINFNEQFKLAVVDIMKDHCLTREAYKKSLDKEEDVARTVEMWKDAFVANDQQKNVIEAAIKKGRIMENDALEILKYWESYVSDLQKKYKSSVNVNVAAFQNIPLTKIDMVALKPGMPYPNIVPNFPTFVYSKTFDFIIQKE